MVYTGCNYSHRDKQIEAIFSHAGLFPEQAPFLSCAKVCRVFPDLAHLFKLFVPVAQTVYVSVIVSCGVIQINIWVNSLQICIVIAIE